MAATKGSLPSWTVEKMKLRENVNIIIENYPFYETLNPKLMEDVSNINFENSYQTNVYGKMSSWRIHSPNIEIIHSWVTQLINRDSKYPTGILKFNDTWFAVYDEGDFAHIHDHHRVVFSFVYFINCPQGSSPLIFTTSGKRIKAEEGKLVIFPGLTKHHVPKNKCKNRVILAGNVVVTSTYSNDNI